MKTVKVLICEDLPSLREHARLVVSQTLERQGITPHFEEAANGIAAVKLAASFQPDLILMDIAMPELNGIKAASQIWKQSPTMKILFWSQYQHEAYIRELGRIVPDEAIHGYLLKTEVDRSLSEALVNVLLLDLPFIGAQIEAVHKRLKDKTSAITDAEYETLLDVFAGLTDKAIAAKEHISYRGAQNRLSNLLIKLLKNEDAYLKESAGKEIFNPRTRLVFEALRRGLLSLEDLENQRKHLDDWLFNEFGFSREES